MYPLCETVVHDVSSEMKSFTCRNVDKVIAVYKQRLEIIPDFYDKSNNYGWTDQSRLAMHQSNEIVSPGTKQRAILIFYST